MHTGLGLHITRRLLGSGSGASALLAGETDGLAFDFTNQSALIRDTSTPANAYNSIGIVNDGALVGPSGKLTYTSPSNKLTRQADGVIRYQAHNLCTYSEDLTNVNWLKGGSSATAVDTITEDGSTGAHRVYRQFASLPTADYRIKVRISASDRHIYFIAQNSSNLVYAWINTSTWTIAESGDNGSVTLDSATLTAVGDGTYDLDIVARNLVGAFFIQFYMADTIGTGPNPPSYAGDTVSTLAVSRIQLNLYPANTDYIKTTTAAKYALPIEYDTSGNCLGLLVEEQRTNLYGNNTTPSTYATPDFVTLTDNYATSPQGITNAHRVVVTSAGPHRFFRTSLSAGLTSYTISCYVKAIDTSGYYVAIREDSTTGAGAVFDPANEFAVVGTYTTGVVSAVNASVEDVGNGWYRIIASYTSTSMTIGAGLTFVNPAWTSGNFYTSWDPGVDKELHFWALQAESGAFPTSPILTYGAAAARAADNISIATSAFPVSTTAGTLYGEWSNLSTAVSTNCGIGLHGATAGNDRAQIRAGAVFVSSGGVNSFNTAPAGYGVSTSYKKYILAYAENDFAACINGNAVSTDVSGATPTSLTTFDFNIDRSTALCVNGHIKAISYVPRRKTDIELAVDTGYSLPTGYASYSAWDLFGTESSALAFDFTDQSVVNTKTPLVSQGIVSDGELVGPGAALTYTSPSNKLTLQSDGYYKYQAHNLCLQSENLSTTWTNLNTTEAASGETPPSPYTTAYTLTDDGTNGRHILYQQFTLVSGASYTASVAVKAGTATHAAITFDGGSANAYAVNVDLSDGSVTGTNTTGTVTNPSSAVTDLGGGWYRVDVSIGAVNGGAACYFTIGLSNSATPTWSTGSPSYTGTGSTIHATGCVLRRTTANTDYIATTTAAKYALPYTYDTNGDCLGLLVEEARTNILTYSTDLANAAWGSFSGDAPVSTNNTAPDGTATACRFDWNGTGNDFRYHATIGTSAATVYTLSFFYKRAASSDCVFLSRDSSAAGYVATLHTATSEWQRYSQTFTATAGTDFGFDFRPAVNGGISATGEVLLWGVQVEAGSFPTSPILSYGAATSRLVDNISIATTAFPHSDSTQSVFVQVITQNATTQGAGVPFFEFHDGTTSNWYRLDRYTSGAACRVTTGGSNETNAVINGFGTNALIQAGGNPFKGAMSIATNDVSYVGNGGTVTTDTTASLPTVTSLKLGAGVGQPPFCGTIQRISVVPRTKSDAELQTETS